MTQWDTSLNFFECLKLKRLIIPRIGEDVGEPECQTESASIWEQLDGLLEIET